MTLTRARAVFAATAAIALMGTGCGSGGEGAKAKPGGEGVTASVPGGSVAESAASNDKPSSGGVGFCDVVRAETAKLKLVVPRAGVAPGPAQLRAFYVASVAADKRTAEVAPAEIKTAADSAAAKSAALATVLERANYDPSKVPASAGTDDEDGSVARVDAYVKRVCGFDRTAG